MREREKEREISQKNLPWDASQTETNGSTVFKLNQDERGQRGEWQVTERMLTAPKANIKQSLEKENKLSKTVMEIGLIASYPSS